MNQVGLVGMKIFRRAADKRPQTRNGFKGAMPWRRVPKDWPRVGVPTGADNGVDIVDVDTKNGAKGADWFWANFESLPKTRMQVTESSGYHVFFRHAEGMRCSTSRIAPGVDVRADGGYVIDWCREGLPVANAGLLADWPEWLLAAALGLAKDKEHHLEVAPIGHVAPSAHGLWRPSATWDGVDPEHRIRSIFVALANKRPGTGRNQALYNYACVYREIMAEGRAELTRDEAVRLLMYAAGSNGSIKKRGREQCMATILSGFGMVERKLGLNDPNRQITSCNKITEFTMLPDGAPYSGAKNDG
jgi:hypothetical protein